MKLPDRPVRIYTDASTKNRIASWGAIVLLDDRFEALNGVIREPCKASHKAESYAIANAVVAARNADLIGPDRPVIVHTDNAFIADLWQRRKQPRSTRTRDWARPMVEFMKQVDAHVGRRVLVQHIQGHAAYGAELRGHWMNKCADRLAREANPNIRTRGRLMDRHHALHGLWSHLPWGDSDD